MHKLVLYGRPECHLCDAVLERLQPMIAGRSVEIEVVDVDGLD